MDAAAAAEDAAAFAANGDAEDFVFEEMKFVREKFHPVRVCSTEDAAEEMEQMGHAFFMFRNVDQKEQVNVVYKRDAGGYGVLIPVDVAA
mmetsp:Transcript_22070/g.54619  ORF Transcript_22070/g.54619 Transcript_22070/m.54619 type:complete len:90 (+) Transcript_22070:78-347(+)